MKLREQVKLVMAKLTGNKVRVQELSSLKEWQDKFTRAKSYINLQAFDDRELLYHGTHNVDKYINSRQAAIKKADNVRNIVYEMIESQIDTSIPQPAVKSKRRGYEFAARMLEESLRNDLYELSMHRIHDENERLTPIQGVTYVQVMWNPETEKLELKNIHPKQLIPQPGVWQLQEMDYFFVLTSVTHTYIKRRYNVDLEGEYEEYPHMNSLDYDTHTRNNLSGTVVEDKVTEIVCWYRDEEGDICRFVWANDQVLEDLPKYYHRRMAVCQHCGQANPQNDEQCRLCGTTKLKKQTMEHEVILLPESLTPIVYKKQRKIVQIDPATGRKVAVDQEEDIVEERVLNPGEPIPYYSPKKYPIAVRINTPKSFSVGGQSDVDIIRDQADSIKKLISKAMQKTIRAGSVLKMPRTLKYDITSDDNQVLRGEVHELNAVHAIALQPDISQDLALAENQYVTIQSTLGINDSWQGKHDASAKSGVAKHKQIQQAAGRLSSKILNKHDFYRQLYEIMFEFKLAFYDEIQPYLTRNDTGEDDWGDFDNHEFLYRDKHDKWAYNTDFLITADAGQGIPSDKMWLFEQVNMQAGAQLIDLIQYWTILEQLHFPHASMILQQHKARQKATEEQAMQQQAMIQQQQQSNIANEGLNKMLSSLVPGQRSSVNKILSTLTPEELEKFKRLPPDQMAEELAQVMEGG